MIVAQEAVATGVNKNGLFIPLIDFGMFLNGGEADKKAVVQGIIDGFKNAGFLYLKNHGIPKETVSKVFASSAEFFRRPQEEKDELKWSTPQSNRGYVSQGREKVSQLTDKVTVDALRSQNPDLKESLEIGRDNHPSLPNSWPREDAAGLAFRQTMNAFYATCQALHIQVMRAIALGLELDENFFDGYVSAADNNLRLLHYPATPADVFRKNVGQVRAGKHSDYGTVTLLFQDMRGGLQVRSPQGSWVDATPIEDTIVVNAGDLLARWSNSIIASTEHQVVEPPSEPVDGNYPARYSCAYFCNPNAEAYIEALPGTFTSVEDKHFPGINAGEYLVQRLSNTYQY
ncbi:hypothetical protein FN846DRAFT_897413 [Sphaerosporella brunnea]|uniref:Fe2OG dioxygenase domain-containing protein n=1 Tax=Sphaerosporella brunnea TaxID=1250544 RepID=A0A5J5F7I2_9PEZI|nr:hypothetical protein FN846DRAFT_897413 [Sphaerosporella brunnea]